MYMHTVRDKLGGTYCAANRKPIHTYRLHSFHPLKGHTYIHNLAFPAENGN